MKKLVAGLFAAAVVASVAYGVTSQNAVGFVEKTIEPGELLALSIPFLNMAEGSDGSWAFKDLDLAKNAPRGTKVFFWKDNAWDAKDAGRNGGFNNVTNVLKPGEFFFIQWPKNAESASLIMSGEVPDDAKIPVVVMGKKNLSAIGNPYPTEMAFKDTDVAQKAPRGSVVYFWSNGTWEKKDAGRNGGFNNVTNVLDVGEGFFFQTSSSDTYDSKEWEVERPYTWPAE